MKTHLKLGTASALALAMALPAVAQPYRETPDSQRARAEYEAQRSQYDAQQEQYQNRREDYRDSREEYQEARRDYERRVADWERARAAYDARFGVGAYARYYARPDWNEGYWASTRNANPPGQSAESRREYNTARRDAREARREYDRRLNEWERARAIYDARYGSGSYARMYARPTWDQDYWSSYSPPPYAGYYGNDANTAVRCNDNNSTIAGGLIGALAGAVLGSNIAGRGDRTEGAVLGGIAGAVVGGAVGNANAKYKCDRAGPYFTYDDTVPYREGRRRYSSSYDSSYYARQNCRLAPAPVDAYGRDVRYVRVCPDGEGRYRITG